MQLIWIILGLAIGGAIGYIVRQSIGSKQADNAEAKAEDLIKKAKSEAEDLLLQAKKQSQQSLDEARKEEQERRHELKIV